MHNRSSFIDIHIGVDNVCENALEEVTSPEFLEHSSRAITFVPDTMYKKHFREAVDGGHGLISNETIDVFNMKTDSLIISRPRFLFSGVPMNTNAGVEKALYKLDSIQLAFSEFHIRFHLYVTDHLTYLFGFGRRDVSLIPNSIVSWLPLINGISERLYDGNELSVKDAERPMALYKGLLEETLGFSSLEAAECLADSDLGSSSAVPHNDAEEHAVAAGWSVEHLDDCYTNDLFAMEK